MTIGCYCCGRVEALQGASQQGVCRDCEYKIAREAGKIGRRFRQVPHKGVLIDEIAVVSYVSNKLRNLARRLDNGDEIRLCEARLSQGTAQCTAYAVSERDGRRVCATHKNVADVHFVFDQTKHPATPHERIVDIFCHLWASSVEFRKAASTAGFEYRA